MLCIYITLQRNNRRPKNTPGFITARRTPTCEDINLGHLASFCIRAIRTLIRQKGSSLVNMLEDLTQIDRNSSYLRITPASRTCRQNCIVYHGYCNCAKNNMPKHPNTSWIIRAHLHIFPPLLSMRWIIEQRLTRTRAEYCVPCEGVKERRGCALWGKKMPLHWTASVSQRFL